MKQKKFLSGLLALTLAAGMCVPVSAATGSNQGATLNPTNNETTIQINSTLYLPKIEVVVGNSTDVIVNPYKQTFDTSKTDSLYSEPTSIENKSDMKINIEATATATVNNDVKFLTSQSAYDSATGPKVYMQYVMGTVANASGVSGFTDSGIPDAQKTVVTKSADPASAAAKLQMNASSFAAFKFIGSSGGDIWPSDTTMTVSVAFSISPDIPTT